MTVRYLFLTSKEHLPLAEEELRRLFSASIKQVIPGFFSLDMNQDLKFVQRLFSRLAFTKQIFLVSQEIHSTEIRDVLDGIHVQSILPEYKIIIGGLIPKELTTKDFADLVYERLESPKVSLSHPQHSYGFFWLENEVLFAEQIFENNDKPFDRRSHLNKYNHPTSIHPKISKAMINLAATDSFHDPFCGAGGLVIEGALMGLQASGSDIVPLMIHRAQLNAKQREVSPNFFVHDALTLTSSVDAYVTDLPYGRNSSLSQDIFVLTEQFLQQAFSLTKIVVLCVFKDLPIEDLAKKHAWTKTFSYSFYVHKSLTRKILVFEHD